MKIIYYIFLIIGCLTPISSSLGWCHQFALGYGCGKEIEQTYTNKGFVASGKFFKFCNVDDTLYASIDGTLADLHASTPDHNHLTTLAAALAMRAYFSNPQRHFISPYLQMSFGPAYLSERQLGECKQGANYAFQTTVELGTEIGCQPRRYDINLRIIHYCNAGLTYPNNGIDLVPVLSIGYLF